MKRAYFLEQLRAFYQQEAQKPQPLKIALKQIEHAPGMTVGDVMRRVYGCQ